MLRNQWKPQQQPWPGTARNQSSTMNHWMQYSSLVSVERLAGWACLAEYRSDLWNLHRQGKTWKTVTNHTLMCNTCVGLRATNCMISDQWSIKIITDTVCQPHCYWEMPLNLNFQNPHKQITFVVFHPRYIWLGQTDNNYRYTYVVAYVYNEVLLLYTTVNNQRCKLT